MFTKKSYRSFVLIAAISALIISSPFFIYGEGETEDTATGEIDAASDNGAEAELDERYSQAVENIRQFNDRCAAVDPVDRPSSFFAVFPIQVVKLPAIEKNRERRGLLEGDIISFSVVGSPYDIAGLVSRLQNPQSKILVDYIDFQYSEMGEANAAIKLFAPSNILIEIPPEKATPSQKADFLKIADRAVREIENFESKKQGSFAFLAEVYARWPIGLPSIRKIVFQEDTFTVYTSSSLQQMDPIINDMVSELNKLADPYKVNLTPLIGNLIDVREIEISTKESSLQITWKGLNVVTVKADKILNHLVVKDRVYMIVEIAPPERLYIVENPEALKERGLFAIQAYNLVDGAMVWELRYFGPTSFSNILFTKDNTLIFGRDFILYSIEPNAGIIRSRIPLSGKAMNLIGNQNDLIVEESIVGGRNIIEKLPGGNRQYPPSMSASERSAAQLFDESLDNLIDPASRQTTMELSLLELFDRNPGDESEMPKALSSRDPNNPWYRFFDAALSMPKSTEESYIDEELNINKGEENDNEEKEPETINDDNMDEVSYPDIEMPVTVMPEPEPAILSWEQNFAAALEMPTDNPYDFLHFGKQFELIGLYGFADRSYKEAFKKFIKCRRPNEIYTRYTGGIFFFPAIAKALEIGNRERVYNLLNWAIKFQPYAEGMDAVEIGTAAWLAGIGKNSQSQNLMEEYSSVIDRGYGLTIRWFIKKILTVFLSRILLVTMLAFWIAMTIKHREARLAQLAAAGHSNFKSRMKFIVETPYNWFRYSTPTYMNKYERQAIILLWMGLFATLPVLMINDKIVKLHSGDAYLIDFDSPAFLDNHKNVSPTGNNPNMQFMFGLSRQQIGEFDKASLDYSQVSSSRAVSPNTSGKALNNLGVIAFNQGDVEKAVKLFRESSAKDPWLPEPIFNRGVVENNKSFKARAVELGLEVEYIEYYADTPVRCGIDNDIATGAMSGFGYKMAPELARRWAEALTGKIAWESGSRWSIARHYILLLLGLTLFIYYFAPVRNSDMKPIEKIEWWELAFPGAAPLFRDHPLIGCIMIICCLFSLSVLYTVYHPTLLMNALSSINLLPISYPGLSCGRILSQEPLINGIRSYIIIITIFSFLICFIYTYITEKYRIGKNRKPMKRA